MTTRLQVLFPDDEIAAIREAAARERVPVATWVRRILREAIAGEPLPSVRTAAPTGRVVREAAPRGYRSSPALPSDLEQLEALLTRLDGADDDAEAAWDAEIARRLEELRAGRARTRSRSWPWPIRGGDLGIGGHGSWRARERAPVLMRSSASSGARAAELTETAKPAASTLRRAVSK